MGSTTTAGCERCLAPSNLAGAGFLTVEASPSGRPVRVTPCACRQVALAERSLRVLNQELPAWAGNLSFDRNPIATLPERALRRIRGYHGRIEERVAEGRGLWLGGATGTGKTAVAALLVQQARRRGVQATFVNVPQLLTRLARARWDDGFAFEEEDLHARLAETPLLVLDDLSAAKDTGYAVEQLYLILNRRYTRAGENATIVTTDLDRRGLERSFGPRLIRRLAHSAGRPVLLDRDAPEPEDVDGFDDVSWVPEADEAPALTGA